MTIKELNEILYGKSDQFKIQYMTNLRLRHETSDINQLIGKRFYVGGVIIENNPDLIDIDEKNS